MEALRVSGLAEQSGQAAFVLDYLNRYGYDNSIAKASPEGLQFFVEQSKNPRQSTF